MFQGKRNRLGRNIDSGLDALEAATTSIGAIHQNLAQHDFQAADRTDIADSRSAMEGNLLLYTCGAKRMADSCCLVTSKG